MAQAYPSDSYTPAALSARGLVAELVLRREEWLVDRVLGHARAHGYSRFTPASREAWRASVASLSAAVCSALESAHDFELSPEATSPDDPISVYAVLEAGRHRQRGVTLSMFLGLIKYYRDSYLELVEAESFEAPAASEARRLVTRFFDRLEIAFCAEWEAHVGEARVRELQVHNRLLTNEKNKYLTLFESLRDAVVLFDGHGAPEHVNGAALALFGHGRAPAAEDAPDVPVVPAGLHGAVRELLRAGHEQGLFDLALGTREGRRELEVGLHRMPDVGGRCEGVVAVLRDVTERRGSELELHRYRAGLEALVIERAHALSESETRYRQLFDLGPDGVLVLRGERVELCNAAAAELAGGASPRELVGRRIFDFLGPPDDVVVAERIAAATASIRFGRQQHLREALRLAKGVATLE